MKTRAFALCAVSLITLIGSARATDWPQWQGPDRSNLSQEKGLLTKWPKSGPKLLWTSDKIGIGFSGPAIVGDRLNILGALKDPDGKETEYLLAMDVKKGEEIWRAKIGPIFAFQGNSWGDGPRGTATVDGDSISAIGGQGELICANKAGQVVWRKNLPKDFGGRVMALWGYCESPLVDGDQVICTPGGKSGSLVALKKTNGDLIWQSKELKDEATYGSMVAAQIGGVRQYVHSTFKGEGQGGRIVGVAAKDGKLLWSFDQPGFATAAVVTPIVKGDLVYASAGYGAGCNLLKITGKKGSGFKATETYTKAASRRLMKNQHGGVVLIKDHVFGYSDGQGWVCQNLKTGAAGWRNKTKLGKGCLAGADGRLYLYSEDDGIVVLLQPELKKWQELGRFEIPKKSTLPQTRKSNSGAKIWTHPVIANGKLYLRDQEFLFCFDVKK